MIDKEYGKYVLVCDVCGEEVTGFDTFDRALDYKDKEGWKSRRGLASDSVAVSGTERRTEPSDRMRTL